MFDFDAGKLIVFGIVALAVIPPKELPRVLRTVGKYVGQARRMATDFQGQFMDAMKEAELDSVRKEIAEIHESAKVDTAFDPANLMRDQMQSAVEAKPAPPEIAPPPAPAIAPPHVSEPHPVPEKAAEKAASDAT